MQAIYCSWLSELVYTRKLFCFRYTSIVKVVETHLVWAQLFQCQGVLCQHNLFSYVMRNNYRCVSLYTNITVPTLRFYWYIISLTNKQKTNQPHTLIHNSYNDKTFKCKVGLVISSKASQLQCKWSKPLQAWFKSHCS